MDLGELLSLLVLMPALAAVGITTLAAFALMTLLGLLPDMSFKRLCFVSFFMGLAAPVLLAMAIFSSFEDGTFERDLRAGIAEFTEARTEDGRPLGGALGELQQIGREVEAGELSESEAEERIKELFVGSQEGTLQIEGPDAEEGDEQLSISIDGVELSQDGDEVQITVD